MRGTRFALGHTLHGQRVANGFYGPDQGGENEGRQQDSEGRPKMQIQPRPVVLGQDRQITACGPHRCKTIDSETVAHALRLQPNMARVRQVAKWFH